MFTNLRNLLGRHDIPFLIKSLIHIIASGSVLLWGSQTWPLKVDVRRLSVSGHHFLSSVGRIWRENPLSNSEVV